MAEYINEKFSPRTSNIKSLKVDEDGLHITATWDFFSKVQLGDIVAAMPKPQGGPILAVIANQPGRLSLAFKRILEAAQDDKRIPADFVRAVAEKEQIQFEEPSATRSV